MNQLDPKTLTDEELKKQLITADYGGMRWKEECLQELIDRKVEEYSKGTSYLDTT